MFSVNVDPETLLIYFVPDSRAQITMPWLLRACCVGEPNNVFCVSICASVQTRKLTETAKPETNVALQSDSLTYLFTCGIVIQILFGRKLNFYNRN